MVVGSSLCACDNEMEEDDELVVEGWICQDSHPIVLIHKSYALNNSSHTEITEETTLEEVMTNQMIPWGRVAISDGTQEIVLTGRLDTLYTPPFVYTTTEITGRVGTNYTVTVDYEQYHATATTHIPEPLGLDSLSVQVLQEAQTAHIIVYLSHLPQDSYFLLEYRAPKEHQFHICPLGTASFEQAKDGVLSINVLSQDDSGDNMTSALHHFEVNNLEYTLRLLRINREQYDYFSGLVSQMASQGVFFMSAYRNLTTNLNGAIGYWAGMGQHDYRFHVNKDTTYIY